MAWKAALAALVASSLACGAAAAADAEKPLPFDHTTILPSGGVYFVEGRVRIPKGVEITIQKDTKLVAHGKDATIEIEGELQIHGVGDSKVVVDGVTFEVQREFGDIRLDMVKVTGASRGIVTPKGKCADGRIFVQNTEFEGAAGLDVTMIGSEVDLQRVYMRAPVRVRAVDPEGSVGNKVKLNLLNNCSGSASVEPGALMGGIVVERVHEVIVRACRIGGEKASFSDCEMVAFDGNQVRCAAVEFKWSEPGHLGRTSITKCDVLAERVVAWAPAAPGKVESIPCDKCWFDGEMNEKTVREKYLRDRDDDPKCGALFDVTKLMENPLLIAGKIKR
jgi:hypothetical protein